MEKKIYEKPAMQLEMFVANHYVAACYHVDCKTDRNNNDYSYLYLDTTGDGELNSGDECVVRNKSFHGCGIQHTGVLSDTALAFNAFVSTNSINNQGWGTRTTRVYAWQIPDPDDVDFKGWHVCYNPTDAERQDTSRPNAS